MSHFPTWEPIAWFTLLLVVVGTLQAVIYRQAVQTTRAMERPWLIVQTSTFDEWDPKTTLDAFLMQHGTQILLLDYVITNSGRSPAFVTLQEVHLDILPLPLPARPTYTSGAREPSQPLAPGRERSNRASTHIEPEQRGAIQQGRSALVFWGRVEYRDTFRRTHRSRFCLLFERADPLVPGEPTRVFVHGGPLGWAEYT